jgi:hypothetical protein
MARYLACILVSRLETPRPPEYRGGGCTPRTPKKSRIPEDKPEVEIRLGNRRGAAAAAALLQSESIPRRARGHSDVTVLPMLLRARFQTNEPHVPCGGTVLTFDSLLSARRPEVPAS